MVKKYLPTRYRVSDLEKTVGFYRDVLGLRKTRRHTSPRGSKLVFLGLPGSDAELELCEFSESGPVQVGPDLSNLAFEVDDIETFAKQAEAKGSEPIAQRDLIGDLRLFQQRCLAMICG
jgi:lactoylglutathione lyase